MATKSDEKKSKIVFKTVLYGVITAALYAAVFSHASTIVEFFARGGAYAVLPIGTVFVFSFAHGAFASNLWSALGIEAITKPAQVSPRSTAPRPAQRPRPRLRVSA
jgi:hypothetical protein